MFDTPRTEVLRHTTPLGLSPRRGARSQGGWSPGELPVLSDAAWRTPAPETTNACRVKWF